MAQTKQLALPRELMGKALGAYTFDELFRIANVCQASGLFEDVTDAAQAFVKIARGQELGFPPMTAMNAFDIIKKRLYIKPWAMAAKINSCSYGSYQVTEQTADRCTIVFRRKYAEQGWRELTPITYTFAEAKAHGLTERSNHWKASPANMLYQRAMTRGGWEHFPELFAGLSVPQDDTPVSEEQHAKNLEDVFGPGADPTLPPKDVTPPQERHDPHTGEVLEDEPPPLFGWDDEEDGPTGAHLGKGSAVET